MLVQNKIVITGSAILTVLPTPFVDINDASVAMNAYLVECWSYLNGLSLDDDDTKELANVIIRPKGDKTDMDIETGILAEDGLKIRCDDGKTKYAAFDLANKVPYSILRRYKEGEMGWIRLAGDLFDSSGIPDERDVELYLHVTFNQYDSPFRTYGDFEYVLKRLHHQYEDYKATGRYDPPALW